MIVKLENHGSNKKATASTNLPRNISTRLIQDITQDIKSRSRFMGNKYIYKKIQLIFGFVVYSFQA